jgi:hypothetical protein
VFLELLSYDEVGPNSRGRAYCVTVESAKGFEDPADRILRRVATSTRTVFKSSDCPSALRYDDLRVHDAVSLTVRAPHYEDSSRMELDGTYFRGSFDTYTIRCPFNRGSPNWELLGCKLVRIS